MLLYGKNSKKREMGQDFGPPAESSERRDKQCKISSSSTAQLSSELPLVMIMD